MPRTVLLYKHTVNDTEGKTMSYDAREHAMVLVEEGIVSATHLLTACLKYMSNDDVADMLDCNELSDRFMEDEDDGQPSEYDEWQDVYGGDDAFETCNFMEDF